MEVLKRCILVVLLILPTILFAGDTIDINSADKEVLMSVKGIGEKRAEAIIKHRNENGPFQSIDQLVEVKGVSQSLVDANRENLSIQEPD